MLDWSEVRRVNAQLIGDPNWENSISARNPFKPPFTVHGLQQAIYPKTDVILGDKKPCCSRDDQVLYEIVLCVTFCKTHTIGFGNLNMYKSKRFCNEICAVKSLI